MKVKQLITSILIVSMPMVSYAAVPAVKTDQEKLSYSLGVMLGERLASDFETIDLDTLLRGIGDAVTNKTPALSRDDMVKTIQDAQKKQAERIQVKMKQEAKENLTIGNSFLNKNKKKSDIISTNSGLQYKIIRKGSGNKLADINSNVTVHYEGKKLDGEMFDSSYERNSPATFKANQVIKGWTEALKLMHEGAEWQLFIPPELAYGPGGIPGKIGPNEVLVFKVELLKVGNS